MTDRIERDRGLSPGRGVPVGEPALASTPRAPRFAPTDHLSTEAVAAYVDGELRHTAYLRANGHLAVCPDCAAEVEAHTAARAALRHCGDVSTPLGLIGALSQIPTREIDLRAAASPRPERTASRRGPLSAAGFPIHRPGRWRNR